MRNAVLTLAAVTALVLAGCKKESPPAPEAQPEPAAEAAAPEAEAPAEAEAEPEPVKIDAGLIKRYAVYERELLDVMKVYVAQVTKEIEKTDKDSTVQVIGAVNRVGKITEAYEQKETELRKKHDLSSEQVDAARDVVAAVVHARALFKSGGAESPEKIVTQMREQLKTVPAEQRAEAEAEVAQMEESFKRILNAQDARDKYGNEPVEAVLSQEADFQKLEAEKMAIFTQKI